MEDDLPSEFDIIIVGTGMVESITAAAASVVGKKVLHLDENSYYGQLWATHNLDGIMSVVGDYKQHVIESNKNAPETNCEGYTSYLTGSDFDAVSNLVHVWYKQRPEEIQSDEDLKNENHSDTPCEIDSVVETPKLQENVANLQQPLDSGTISSSEDPAESTASNFVSEQEAASVLKCSGEKVEAISEPWTKERMLEMSRKFNVDLSPKVIYSNGQMVKLLLKSTVSKYAEFQSVRNILTYKDGKVIKVPCSKSDVFSSKDISIIDKRILMKVLNLCCGFDDSSPVVNEYKNKTFCEFLSDQKVPEHLIHYLVYSISMSTNVTPFEEAMRRLQQFAKSTGVYSNSPFLWALYGSGDLLQGFCRLSAVFGGIYYLARGAEAVVTEGDKCVGVFSKDKIIRANHLVMTTHLAPKEFVNLDSDFVISRTILITDRSLFPVETDSSEGISLLCYPPSASSHSTPVMLLELPESSSACPRGLFIVHVTHRHAKDEEDDGLKVVNDLFEKEVDEDCLQDAEILVSKLESSSLKTWLSTTVQSKESSKPRILYMLHYDLKEFSNDPSSKHPANLHLCIGPDIEPDFDISISQAKQIFERIFPEETFLDPESRVLELEAEEENEECTAEEDPTETLESEEINLSLESCHINEVLPSGTSIEHEAENSANSALSAEISSKESSS